jgi:hypothetical protein
MLRYSGIKSGVLRVDRFLAHRRTSVAERKSCSAPVRADTPCVFPQQEYRRVGPNPISRMPRHDQPARSTGMYPMEQQMPCVRVDWILSIALWSAGELSPIPSGHAPNASGVKTSAFGSAEVRVYGKVGRNGGILLLLLLSTVSNLSGRMAVWLHQPASKEIQSEGRSADQGSASGREPSGT